MSSEFLAVLDLVGMLVASPRTGVLIGLLVLAAVSDIQTGRIPNWLVLIGTIYAVTYSAFYPIYPRDMGLLVALGGLAVGFASLLPGYLLRVLGAGDVKLMAMVGAFLGTWGAVEAVLASLIAGGLLALALAAYSGRLVHMLRNVAMVFRGTLLGVSTGVGGLALPGGTSAGRMPYGVAIAAGTIGHLMLDQLGLI